MGFRDHSVYCHWLELNAQQQNTARQLNPLDAPIEDVRFGHEGYATILFAIRMAERSPEGTTFTETKAITLDFRGQPV